MNSKKRSKVTLKDIAQATGYSINTVSRSLRDKSDIGPETKKKIRAIAKKMGHFNNALASSLRLGYSSTIAVILADVSNPHFAIIMKGIEDRARGHGYNTFLLNTNEDSDLERKAIESAFNKNVDGIIICPTQRSPQNINFLKRMAIPFVLIGRHFDNIKTDYVICNDTLGGYQATKHLLELGHRRILMINGPKYISSARERVAGYQQAYREAQLPFDPGLIHAVSVTGSNCDEVIRDIIHAGTQFTAVFAFSDMIAWRVWHALIELGQMVPQDISLVGFDNIQSHLILPMQLDTVSTGNDMMSAAAVEILVDKMQKPAEHSTQFVNRVLDTRLVLKGSSIRHPPFPLIAPK